jgi:hypothetical protein
MKKDVMILLFSLMLIGLVFAGDCPFGEVDCQEPGKCGNYVDANKDALCDHSQENLDAEEQMSISENVKSNKYNFFPLTIFLILIYIVSHVLSKRGKISIRTHRKIWNVLLTITFLLAGLTGVYFVLKINYGFTISTSFNLMRLHVQTGIAMTLICIFHIIWHWPYFKYIFKR